MNLQDENYETSQQSLNLLDKIREKDAIIEGNKDQMASLKQEVIDVRTGCATYIPVKRDIVDETLGDYINKLDHQKMRIMFMRESAGVYEFGQKRVMVRVERGKIQIKVGGGYLSIDEFLEQYTPDELAKLKRRDPFKKLTD